MIHTKVHSYIYMFCLNIRRYILIYVCTIVCLMILTGCELSPKRNSPLRRFSPKQSFNTLKTVFRGSGTLGRGLSTGTQRPKVSKMPMPIDKGMCSCIGYRLKHTFIIVPGNRIIRLCSAGDPLMSSIQLGPKTNMSVPGCLPRHTIAFICTSDLCVGNHDGIFKHTHT